VHTAIKCLMAKQSYTSPAQ